MPTEWDQLYRSLLLKNRILTEKQVNEAMAAVRAAEDAGKETSLVQVLRTRELLTLRQVEKLARALDKSLPDAKAARGDAVKPSAKKTAGAFATRPGSAAITKADLKKAALAPGEGIPARKAMEVIESTLGPLVSPIEQIHTAPLGAKVGRYRVEAPVAEGGMAMVYRAKPMTGGASAAIKVMKGVRGADPSYVRRFFAEAATCILVDEAVNVVEVFEVGVHEGRPYIAMEYIEGETLRERVKRGPIPEEEGVEILHQVVQAILAAHEQGITHRDIKPGNILLTTNEERFGFGIEGEFEVNVKLTDFGLARVFGEEDLGNVDDQSFLGTAKYVAPEMAKGEPPTFRSDVFALGVLAYQMFAGKDPFPSKKASEYVWHNVHTNAKPIDQVRGDVSRSCARVVAKMMAKDPSYRYDAEALLRDLSRLRGRTESSDEIKPVSDDASAFRKMPVATRKPSERIKKEGGGGLSGWLSGLTGGGSKKPTKSKRPSRRRGKKR